MVNSVFGQISVNRNDANVGMIGKYVFGDDQDDGGGDGVCCL